MKEFKDFKNEIKKLTNWWIKTERQSLLLATLELGIITLFYPEKKQKIYIQFFNLSRNIC